MTNTLETCVSMPYRVEIAGGDSAEAYSPQAALVAARELRFDVYHAAIMQGTTLPAAMIYHNGRHVLSIARGPNAQLDTFYPRKEGA